MSREGVGCRVNPLLHWYDVQGNNASMYVRPLLFASGQMLGLAPLASEYTFFVTVLPAGGYFGKGSEVGVKAWFHMSHVGRRDELL